MRSVAVLTLCAVLLGCSGEDVSTDGELIDTVSDGRLIPLAGEERAVWAIGVIAGTADCDDPDLIPLSTALEAADERGDELDAFLADVPISVAFEHVLTAYDDETPPFDGSLFEADTAMIGMMYRLAQRGEGNAMNEIGIAQYRCYLSVERDVCEAVDWLNDARLSGDRLAAASLGYMSLGGAGLSRNETIGLNRLRYAARHGDLEAAGVIASYEAGELDEFLAAPPLGPLCKDEARP